MQDIIALMQSLTLPAGATVGARIELDGTTGQIRIYNSSGQLVGQIDTSGIITIYDPVGGSNIKLSPTAPPVILFTPATFGVHAIGTGSIGTDEQTVPDRARLLIDSPSLDGADRSQITLEHATTDIPHVYISDGSAANVGARLEVFGDVEASTAGTGRKGDFLVDQVSLPRGLVFDTNNGNRVPPARTTNIGPFAAEADLTGLTTTWTADPTRQYRLRFTAARWASSVAGDYASAFITDNSNNHVAESRSGQFAIANTAEGPVVAECVLSGPSVCSPGCRGHKRTRSEAPEPAVLATSPLVLALPRPQPFPSRISAQCEVSKWHAWAGIMVAGQRAK